MGILVPVVMLVKRHAQEVSSKAMLDGMSIALNQYKFRSGTYPIKPGGHGFDGVTAADFYQTPCAPMGQPANGTEDNSEFVQVLESTCEFHCKQSNLKNGRLVDDFGTPVIVRFLAVSAGDYADVKMITWSYGYDRKNGIDASPTYSFTGAPTFDQVENNKIEASIKAMPDDLVQR